MTRESYEQAVIERLDLVVNIVRLAYAGDIAARRAVLEADAVARDVLAATTDYVRAGALQESVSKSAGVSTRTVARRVAELVQEGVLTQRGAGSSIEYKRSGLL